jgi:hypothetical protein
MKEANVDAITFVPNPENETETVIHGLTYNEKGETIGASSMGDLFDIILFRENEETFYDNEQFEAILVCPYTYSEKMMKDGHFGMIARKTTTSGVIVEPFRHKINELIGQPV